MGANSNFGSNNFEIVAKNLISLHRLIRDGQDDSPEAEFIRDAMDAPLKSLNRMEAERAQWLSEDLYSISEPSAATLPRALNPQAQQELDEAVAARQNREWDRALALLRRIRENIAPVLLSYLRGSIWLQAGNPDVAAMFFNHAAEGEPSNVYYRAISHHAMAISDVEYRRKSNPAA